MIADESHDVQDSVRGTEIQTAASGMLGAQLNTKTAPAGSYTRPRPDHTLPATPERRASLMVSMPEVSSHIDGRTHLIEMLDEVRRQSELVVVNRARFVLLAHAYGMPRSEIAEYVGLSLRAVKKLIRRTAGTPGMEFGGQA